MFKHWWIPLQISILQLLISSSLLAQRAEPTPGVQEIPQRTTIPQIGAQPTAVARSSSATDAARYLAGLPVPDNSSLSTLTRDTRWQAHAAALNTDFAPMVQRQLRNIRIWSAGMIPDGRPKTRLYHFHRTHFLYSSTIYPLRLPHYF